MLKKKQKTTKFRQTVLDFGQKKIHTKTCTECLMRFHPLVEEDVKLHDKYHENITKGIEFNHKDIVKPITIIKQNSSLWIKFLDLLKRINEELGAEQQENLKDYQAFLLINEDNRAIGCCLCKPITHAFKIAPCGDYQKTRVEVQYF